MHAPVDAWRNSPTDYHDISYYFLLYCACTISVNSSANHLQTKVLISTQEPVPSNVAQRRLLDRRIRKFEILHHIFPIWCLISCGPAIGALTLVAGHVGAGLRQGCHYH